MTKRGIGAEGGAAVEAGDRRYIPPSRALKTQNSSPSGSARNDPASSPDWPTSARCRTER